MSYFPVPKNTSKTASLVNQGPADYITLSTDPAPVPSVEENGAIWEHSDTGDRFRWTSTVWVADITDTTNHLAEVTETSNRGNKGVAVFIQDQTTGVLDLRFLANQSAEALAVDAVVGALTIILASGHTAVAGQTLELADQTDGTIFTQCTILSVVVDAVTLDTPINYPYAAADTYVSIGDAGMAVDGSVTPVVYSVNPLPDQVGDMVRIICTISDNTDMDFETFGGLTALTNGVVLRVNNGDGTYRNIANFKTNGAIQLYAFDAQYLINNGGGIRAFIANMTWGGQSKHGVVVRLDGSLNEQLELVIQDDLTGLEDMTWLAQGSEVQ